MLDRRFLLRKFHLARYTAQLVGQGRYADALTILHERRLGYAAMEWRTRLPMPCHTIVDAGAHTGEVSAALDFAFRPARILAIEANPVRAAGLRSRFAARPHIRVTAVALAENKGTLPFFIQDFDAASSLFQLREGYLASLGLPEGNRRIEVPAQRLEQVVADAGIAEVDLLKLDCQGAELRILQGAGDLLRRIRHIYTEVTFEPIYAQGAQFHELHAFLRSAGFRLAQLHADDAERCSISQGDALYVRSDDSPPSPSV
jgi:FkbM family methyltransferase